MLSAAAVLVLTTITPAFAHHHCGFNGGWNNGWNSGFNRCHSGCAPAGYNYRPSFWRQLWYGNPGIWGDGYRAAAYNQPCWHDNGLHLGWRKHHHCW
jgi:hypothetical protein